MFRLSAFFPDAVEHVYSRGLFTVIVQIQYFFTGSVGFSVGEFIVYVFVLFLLVRTVFAFRSLLSKRISKKTFALKACKGLFLYAGIIYFLFIFLWGFNYNRKPLAELLLDSTKQNDADISTQELSAYAESIIVRINALSSLVPRDENKIFKLSDAQRKGIKYQAKPFMLSALMSKTGISGVYIPFTGEANYNRNMPNLSIPFSVAHESAHRLGFARENEANLIAYLTCLRSASPEVKYSAELYVLSYMLSAIHKNDELLFEKLLEHVNEAVKKDIRHRNEFWKSQRGAIYNISGSINNIFLKANMQRDGIESYGRFIELLILMHRKGLL